LGGSRLTPSAQSWPASSATQKTDEQVLNDLFWALLNAKEFVFNH